MVVNIGLIIIFIIIIIQNLIQQRNNKTICRENIFSQKKIKYIINI